LSVVVALFVVAAAALIAATTLTAIVLSADSPERCCPAPAGGPASLPSPTPRSSSSRAAGPPLCLIGSWRSVDEAFMIKFYTDQPPIPFVSSGRRYEYRPDGTAVEQQDNVLYTGSFQGHELRMVGNGALEFTWQANDGSITYAALTKSTLTFSYYDQRGLLGTQPVPVNNARNEVDEYTCQATQLAEHGPSTGYRSAWIRTAASGVYG
jgi:hypothetical protein